MAGLVEARWGHKKGEDGGCFASALASVRKWGGVLEHPAYSDAWPTFGLPVPMREGGWQRGICGGWSAHVEQGRYGHLAKKATWLYAHGTDLPTLRWGYVHDSQPHPTRWRDSAKREKARALVLYMTNHTDPDDDRPRLSKKAASATPPEFREVLLALARSVRAVNAEARP